MKPAPLRPGNAALLLWLLLLSCQSPLPVRHQRPRPLLSVEVALEGGYITLEAHLRWPTRRLLNVVRPFGVDDVKQVEITLHRQPGDIVGPPIASLRLVDPATFEAPLRFKQLSPYTPYVLRGTAYDQDNRVISDPAESEVRLTLADDDAPPPVELQIRLRDQSFATAAQLPGIGLLAGARLEANRGFVATAAGGGAKGRDEALGTRGLCLPGPEQERYLVDTDHHRVCRLAADGTLHNLAGTGAAGAEDGPSATARFNAPEGLALGPDGTLYVADTGNHSIRAISPTGAVTTLGGSTTPGYADGLGSAARFQSPSSIVLRADGQLVVADRDNHALRLLHPDGQVSTLAGDPTPGLQDGPGVNARFFEPLALVVGGGDSIYVLDRGNQSIRAVDSAGDVSTLLTFESNARLTGLAYHAPDQLWVANATQNNVQQLNLLTGTVTTAAGAGTRGFLDGAAETAQFNNPVSLASEQDGSLWIWDAGGLRALAAQHVITVLPSGAGDRDASGANARFFGLSGISEQAPGVLWVADSDNHRIRVYQRDGRVSTLAGSTAGFSDGPAAVAQFNRPWHLAAGPGGSQWVTDRGNHSIRQISDTGMVSTLAGSGEAGYTDGAGFAARFSSPTGLVQDTAGTLFVADTGNHCIRRITPAGAVSTWAGNGQTGADDDTRGAARFNAPEGLAIAPDGTLYVADTGNRLIRQISPAGEVQTWAGTGATGAQDGARLEATFTAPRALALQADGTLYIADGHRLRRISPAGAVDTLAGDALAGWLDEAGLAARFNAPRGLGLDAEGSLFVADSGNHRLRRVR